VASNSILWQQRLGKQRDWVWRGWQIRYSFFRPPQSSNPTPLLLVHGFGAAIEHWRQNIPVLGEHYAVYALDLLGFGASRKAETTYSASLWAEQIYDFWRTFIREPIVLVGNSIGSLACATAAAEHPEMVAAIALLNLPDVSVRQETIPRPLQPVVSALEEIVGSPLLLKTLLRVLRRPSILRRWVAIAYEDDTAVTDELVEILHAPACDRGAGDAFYSLFKSVRQPQFAPSMKTLLPTLNIPILLVWGRQDRMVPFSLAESFVNLNPRLELVEFNPAGHCPHDECPEQFNTLFLNWLDRRLKQKKGETSDNAIASQLG